MARPLRIFYNDAYYHVMNRGAAKQKIFHSEGDRYLFLSCLVDAHETFNLKIHAYCLMDNHYHLLVSTPDGNLDRAMRHTNGVYTQKFNKRTGRDGPLFRGRYKAILVENNNYLANVSRYIHLNPVEAGIVKSAGKYRWSSYYYYLQDTVKKEWIERKDVLALFGTNEDTVARGAYSNFVDSGLDNETIEFYSQIRLKPILGSAQFVAKHKDEISDEQLIASAHDVNLLKKPISLQVIIQVTADYYHRDISALLFHQPGRKNEARSVALYIARFRFAFHVREIASEFGYKSVNSLSSRLKRIAGVIKNSPELHSKVKMIYEQCVMFLPEGE